MIRSQFSFSQVCKPSPLTSAGSSAAQGVSKQRLQWKHYNYDHIFNSSQLCAVRTPLPFLAIIHIDHYHQVSYLQIFGEDEYRKKARQLPEIEHSNPSSGEVTILLSSPVSWQSPDKRWKSGPTTAKAAAFNSWFSKVEFSVSFPQLILLWILHCHVSIVNKWQYDHRHEAGS